MQVYLVVVLLAHVARHETFLLQRIGGHHTCLHRFLNLVVEFFHTTDAHFFACVTVAPNRKGSAPIAGAGEIPVVEVFEPLAETSGTSRFGFPLDGLVQLKHAVFLRS